MSDLTVANTILQQLGGRRFKLMTGSSGFIGTADSLSFHIGSNPKKVTAAKITLQPDDTYKVVFYRKAPRDAEFGIQIGVEEISAHQGVHADQLEHLFVDATGLHTRL